MPITDGKTSSGDLEWQGNKPTDRILPAHGESPIVIVSSSLQNKTAITYPLTMRG
jgi:hypothetical protein